MKVALLGESFLEGFSSKKETKGREGLFLFLAMLISICV